MGDTEVTKFLTKVLECCDWLVHVGGSHTVWEYNLMPEATSGVLCKTTQVLLLLLCK